MPAPLPAALPGEAFRDVTLAAGIDAEHRLPGGELGSIVDAVGSGAAFSDLDGDGWLDLVTAGGLRSPRADAPAAEPAGLRVYRNLRNGRFEDVTAATGLTSGVTAVAIAAADVDGDGLRDLYVVDRGPNRLLRNRGGLVFEDVTERAGVGDPRFGVGAVFFDMDRDGDLDLYVTNYLEYDPRERAFYAPDGFPGPLTFRSEGDVLYRNRGDGTFEDATQRAGIGELQGRGMSVAAFDADDDGDTDVFVANDVTENFLLLNDGHGRFTEGGLLAGVALGASGEQTSAMAPDVGDVDGDGQLDLVVSDTAFGAVYLRRGPGFFVDEAMRSGVGMLCGQYVSWGQNLIDFDNDGDLDLFVVNGGLHHLVGWEDLLLRNTGGGSFEDASGPGGSYFATRRVSRGSIAGDYDNDGDVDLLVTTLDGRPVLLRNDAETLGSWITLDLEGRSARDPFGARVRIGVGDRTWLAEGRCPTGYLGQSDPRIHFGLGPGIETVDLIHITWPDGTTTQMLDVPARQILRIRQEGT